ncbi:YceI family protein [Novosphingobium sp. MMS21-SN21R]|uniref:YceI family protein n=1 Tax=Novosphingobium sp. MMS21-SN21R TaxID=2969298 RepID=UPI002886F174|nr:YceI family protein [Novosphingobium sp. MMS21-SN21R]MDT0508305.1 cytochrome b/b6 domain-containing protein [Novosphingobium sp. MMS21-SN21R]
MTELRPARYSLAAIILHWAIAALLLFQIGLGWALEDLPKGVAQFAGFQFHKSVGIAILLLSLARLAVRSFKPRPLPVPASRPQMLLASGVHLLLYAVMVLGPLTGWIIVSTAKIRLQTMLFGVVPWPDLPVGAALHEPAEGLHGLLGTIGFLLIVLHVAGALFHHFKREDVIGRMLPAAISSHKAIGFAAAAAVIAGLGVMIAGRSMTFAAAPVSAPSAAASSEPEAVASALVPAVDVSEAPPAAVASVESADAKASTWTIGKGGRLGFKADYTGESIKGTFARWDAAIVFDPADLPGSSIKVTVDLASVESGDSQRDDMLKSDSFFGVGTNPKAVFTSSSIRANGSGRYVASGSLSLHGKSRPLAVRFNLKIDGDRATASGNAALQRLSFGVGEAEWSATDQLKDAVGIDFALSATRKPG